MIQPTVIRIGKGAAETAYWCQLIRSPKGEQFESTNFNLQLAADGEGAVRATGAQLFTALCTNPKVKEALEDALARIEGVGPIYIDPTVLDAQGLRWETLWSDVHGFLALNRRWQIARRAEPQVGFEKGARFRPPLRVLAVISADGIPGKPEWNALQAAVDKARVSGFAIEVQVLTGEEMLFQQLRDAPPDGTQVAAVPGTLSDFNIKIMGFQPHILHLFCHGDIDGGSAWLDIRTGIEDQPLRVPIDQLVDSSGVRKIWLVVLNSCLGGALLEKAPAMACQLVTKGGVPFAIGAAESVDARDAHTFSKAFYARLLFDFASAFRTAHPNDEIVFDWTAALHAARAAIDQQYQNKSTCFRQWALPVLYERRDQFQITRDGDEVPDNEAALRLKIAMNLLSFLPPGTPEATKRKLIAAALG